MMTPEEQRIAIARACGWKQVSAYGGRAHWAGRWEHGNPNPIETSTNIPDYLNDLNAMREAVLSQPDEFQEQFDYALKKLYSIPSATAGDWAGIFLHILRTK